MFQRTTFCHRNTLQAALQCKCLHSSHGIHCKWCILECGGIFILSCIDLCYERCHIHVLLARRNSAGHCRLSRVGVHLWMAWVDGTMLPALSLWHFLYRTEELKGGEKRAHHHLLLPPSSPPCLELGTEGSKRGLHPIRMRACHRECLSCYAFSLLINASFESRRSGTFCLVSLIAF